MTWQSWLAEKECQKLSVAYAVHPVTDDSVFYSLFKMLLIVYLWALLPVPLLEPDETYLQGKTPQLLLWIL